MKSITPATQFTLDSLRNVLDEEILSLARALKAGLYLTGSQYYAGHGEDHDYRMVVADLSLALRQLTPLFPEARRLLPFLCDGQVNTVGLKFNRHGAPLSLQLHSRHFIDDLCRLSAVKARVLRTSPTSLDNPVFGIDGTHRTPQPHYGLGTDIWLVEIDQNPWLHQQFCTQIYHNMIVAARVLRDDQGLSRDRRNLISRLAEVASQEGAPLEVAPLRWLSRNQERWNPLTRAALIAEFHLIVQRHLGARPFGEACCAKGKAT